MTKLTSPPAFTRVATGDSGFHVPGDIPRAPWCIGCVVRYSQGFPALGHPLGAAQHSRPRHSRHATLVHHTSIPALHKVLPVHSHGPTTDSNRPLTEVSESPDSLPGVAVPVSRQCDATTASSARFTPSPPLPRPGSVVVGQVSDKLPWVPPCLTWSCARIAAMAHSTHHA